MNTDPAAIEAELAMIALNPITWRNRQTTWRGLIIAYEHITNGRAGPNDVRTVLYAADGARLGATVVSGVTERELEHKTLTWAIGMVFARQELEQQHTQGAPSPRLHRFTSR